MKKEIQNNERIPKKLNDTINRILQRTNILKKIYITKIKVIEALIQISISIIQDIINKKKLKIQNNRELVKKLAKKSKNISDAISKKNTTIATNKFANFTTKDCQKNSYNETIKYRQNY